MNHVLVVDDEEDVLDLVKTVLTGNSYSVTTATTGEEALLKDNIVVLDCTSATKPASIAFYELAQEYLVPLIYVYEQNQSLKWLISKEKIKQQLNIKDE